MLRCDKRESVLSIIISSGYIYRDLEKRSSKSWAEKNKTWMRFADTDVEIFNWKLNLIHETEWLWNEHISYGEINEAIYYDTNKLRIYYKWMHKNNVLTYKKILRYMKTPLLAAMLVMDFGQIDDQNKIIINKTFDNKNIELLRKWFVNVLGIEPTVVNNQLVFENQASANLLLTIESYVYEARSKYDYFYNRLNTRLWR